MKLVKVANGLSMLFAIAIVFMSILFAYVTIAPVDVLKNWHLTADKPSYAAGDTITVHSTFVKTRSVPGASFRYLECTNPSGSVVRYPIDQADGNRPASVGDVEILLHVPDTLPNLPAKCHVNVTVVYSIYSFRKATETNVTQDFMVVK